MMSTFTICILIGNSFFFVFLFFYFQKYIQKELAKSEYVFRIEEELRGLLLDTNRTADDFLKVIESKIDQLEILQKNHQENDSFVEHISVIKKDLLQQFDLYIADLAQRATKHNESLDQSAAAHRQIIEKTADGIEALYASIQLECETVREELVYRGEEQAVESLSNIAMDGPLAEAVNLHSLEFGHEARIEEASRGVGSSRQESEMPLQVALLPKKRREIKHYLQLGLDARIISQKTGVPLSLVEMLEHLKSI